MRKYLPAILMACALAVPAAHAGTVTVDARTSIFSSSVDADGSRDNSSMGSVVIALPAGAQYVSFSATGLIDPAYGQHGADGGYFGGNTVNTNSWGSISGIMDDSNHTLALLGAFTSGTPASGSAPARLNFSGNHDFASLSPLLNQSFFIGDGKTGAGVVQTFYVPAGATHLQLGFADAYTYSGTPFHGDPAAYSDNHGSLSVTYDVTAATAVPTPAAAAGGLALLGGLLAKRRRD